MIAFGSCINNTVSYAISMCQYEQSNKYYYIGYLVFISDGTLNGNTFLFEAFSDTSNNLLEEGAVYACQNLNNKIKTIIIITGIK